MMRVEKGQDNRCFLLPVMKTLNSNYVPPMPLDVDNGLPGIELWFGDTEKGEVGVLCHLDTCAAMSTGNLRVYK